MIAHTSAILFRDPQIPHRPTSAALMYELSLHVSRWHRQYVATLLMSRTFEHAMQRGDDELLDMEQIGQPFSAYGVGPYLELGSPAEASTLLPLLLQPEGFDLDSSEICCLLLSALVMGVFAGASGSGPPRENSGFSRYGEVSS